MNTATRKTETPSNVQVSDATPILRSERKRLLYVVTRAEIAECTCPEPCERDHANE